MSETDWRDPNGPPPNTPKTDYPWGPPPPPGAQRYVEEPMGYLDNPADNPADGWTPPPPPTPASTWAFVLGMLAAVLGLFLSAMDWALMAIACLPAAFFVYRSVVDGRRGVRQNKILLFLGAAGIGIGGLCAIWGFNTMQDVQDGLDCVENAETLYEMGQC